MRDQNALTPEVQTLLQRIAADLLKKIDLIKQHAKFSSRIEELLEESNKMKSKKK